jgi:transposase
MRNKPYRLPLPASRSELAQVLERLRDDALEESDRQLLMRLIQQLIGPDAGPPPAQSPTPADTEPGNAAGSETTRTEPEIQRRGHGRKAAAAYPGAQHVRCPDVTRQVGDRCVCGGRLYQFPNPTIFLRFTGQPLVGATQYEQSVLRCSSCQQRFTAPLPDGVAAEKYDATADVAMVMAKYAAGLPFHRLARMQQSFGVPLPESVQWERCEAGADALLPIYFHLWRRAAQADVLVSDDTRVQILSCEAEKQQRVAAGERCGLHTTGLVAQSPAQHTLVLYSSGRKHAGENVGNLLRSRLAESVKKSGGAPG